MPNLKLCHFDELTGILIAPSKDHTDFFVLPRCSSKFIALYDIKDLFVWYLVSHSLMNFIQLFMY